MFQPMRLLIITLLLLTACNEEDVAQTVKAPEPPIEVDPAPKLPTTTIPNPFKRLDHEASNTKAKSSDEVHSL